jgi:hypothetical protein
MTTSFRLVPESKSVDLNLAKLQSALPATMRVDERPDGVYVNVASAGPEDEQAQMEIDRELDRVYLLTCVALRAQMVRRSVTATLAVGYRIHGQLPAGIGPANWSAKLALQLRLWRLASEANDSTLRVLLYFQIIELEYPETTDRAAYPPYTDSTLPPHPRTEAKLLRHLVAHATQPLRETGLYLQYLGLPPQLSNHSHPEWSRIISVGVKAVEQQAREVLRSAA